MRPAHLSRSFFLACVVTLAASLSAEATPIRSEGRPFNPSSRPALVLVALAGSAPGAVLITARQVGSDVVLTGGGSINTTGLTLVSNTPSWVTPSLDTQSVRAETGQATSYTGFSGPSAVGSGGVSAFSSSTTGQPFGITQFNGRLFVPRDYVSGTPLLGTPTYSNRTLASFGLVDGTYTYTWGSGANADSLVIDIAVPEPATLSLLVGSAALALRRRSR